MVMLWNVKINARQKLALTGIFSLTVITMMFAIIRVAVVTRQTRANPDSTWLYLWSAIEPPVGKSYTPLWAPSLDETLHSCHHRLSCLFPKFVQEARSKTQTRQERLPKNNGRFFSLAISKGKEYRQV